jgi:beta-lactamase class C
MTNLLRPICFLTLGALCACSVPDSSANQEDPEAVRAAVDAAILPVLEAYDIPGMAVAVAVDGQSHFFSYGVASRETGTPVTEQTIFEVGSVSKTFTATLAAYAQVTGRLSLDDHPSKYMPQLQGSPIDGARLLNLGTYTAGGLPLQFPDEITDNASMLRYFSEWQPDADPGAQRRYSNPSLGLFGHIAGIAMGGDFVEVMEAQILPGLGLDDSYVRVTEEAAPRYAWGYNAANEAIRVNPGMFDAEAYGIKSTAADMIRFVQSHFAAGALDSSMQRALEETRIGYFEMGEMTQGLGWEQYPFPVSLERLLAGNSTTMIMEANPAGQLTPPVRSSGPTLFNKTGSTNGFGAYVLFVPEEEVGIVMLANRNYPNAARIEAAYEILERVTSTSLR